MRDDASGVAARHLLEHCAAVRVGESVLIVTDYETRDVGDVVLEAASGIGVAAQMDVVPVSRVHGEEPPAETAARMCRAEVVVGLTSRSLAHTEARRHACDAGARYLSLPDYSLDFLADPAILTDFRALGPRVREVARRLDGAREILVRSAAGTEITLSARGRAANACPGYVDGPGQMGSPPDAEANVAPLEDSAHGTIVVDGSIPHPGIGLLGSPVVLTVRSGSIQSIAGEGPEARALDELIESTGNRRSRVLAELGIGLNDRARLTGQMLTDEGAGGTLHFGFGSNATIGGTNAVPFHVDCVLCEPDVDVDGTPLLRRGEYVPPPEGVPE